MCGAIALTLVAWLVMAPAYSIKDAVDPGARHIQQVISAAPDYRSENPVANNFISAPFLSSSNCRAGSVLIDSMTDGVSKSGGNLPQRIQTGSKGRGLYLLAQPGVQTNYANGPGMRVLLVNGTHDLLAFHTCGGDMPIIQEALGIDGIWKPIEHYRTSFCGNAYYRVFLPANHYWEFAVPRYQGSLHTKLRFSMRVTKDSSIHSATFDGSVDPAQFTEKFHGPARVFLNPNGT